MIRSLIIGFIHKFEQYSEINKVFLKKMYEFYLIKLSKSKLPSNILDDESWPIFHPKPLNNVIFKFYYFLSIIHVIILVIDTITKIT